MLMSARAWTLASSRTSVCSSITKKRFMRSQPDLYCSSKPTLSTDLHREDASKIITSVLSRKHECGE